jgi:hypothetical protein
MRLPALIKPSPRRDWVTPEDVNVSPDLLGCPLARPSQRAWAMALDLALIGLASSLGNWLLLGSVAAAAWLRIRTRGAPPGARSAPSRLWWLPVALCFALGVLGVWHDLSSTGSSAPTATREEADAAPEGATAVDDHVEDWASAVSAVSAVGHAASIPGLSMEQRRIEELESQVRRLRRSEKEALAHSGFKPRAWLDEALGEAGLRFSLAIVYFTLLPVLWPGQTIGKRLMGLKVAELSGKPMTLMRSFSRYGGYLASMGTGGMGFLQLFWDANRQTLQDKAAHTVVVDLRRQDRLPLDAALTPPTTPEHAADATSPEPITASPLASASETSA